MDSICQNGKIVQGVAPQTINNTHVDGAGIDRQGYEAAAFVVSCGAIAGGAVCSFKVQQSDDDVDGNYADIAGAAKAFTDAQDDLATVIEVGPNNLTKRYVRLVATNGAAFAAIMGGVGILLNGRSRPVTQSLAGVFLP